MPVHNQFFWPQVPGQPPQIGPQVLAVTGPVLQVEVCIPSDLEKLLAAQNQPIPQPVTGWALIDTGASRTAVEQSCIASLGVQPIGATKTGTAGGIHEASIYPARLRFPGQGMDMEFSSTLGVNLKGQKVGGKDLLVLIGRDVLARGVLIYNGTAGGFTFCY
jgi:predicted aspartyl protease